MFSCIIQKNVVLLHPLLQLGKYRLAALAAALAELVDAPDLGSGSERSESSSLLCRTL